MSELEKVTDAISMSEEAWTDCEIVGNSLKAHIIWEANHDDRALKERCGDSHCCQRTKLQAQYSSCLSYPASCIRHFYHVLFAMRI